VVVVVDSRGRGVEMGWTKRRVRDCSRSLTLLHAT
jgi:hypothetical protein